LELACKIVFFLLWVNGLPPLVGILVNDRFNQPIDGGRQWLDGKPVFGSHKTIRGLLASLLGGTALFPLLGVAWWCAALAALLAMAGDLLSSFIKRRRTLASGEDVVILDQFFESFFPLFFLSFFVSLSLIQFLTVLICFIFIAYWFSRFQHYILYRPPLKNYPRLIRSTVRLREWKACHMPLARWHALLNLTSFLSNLVFLTGFFKLTGLYAQGERNALDVKMTHKTFSFPSLPAAFDKFTLLLLTDLHLDGLPGLTDELIRELKDVRVDLCLVGGDIRMHTYGPIAPSLRKLRRLLPHIQSRHGILGVLGNHDCIEMTPDFEEAGMIMLINDSWEIKQGGGQIRVVGVDDPHYYKMDDASQAYRGVPDNAFTIFLAHSPEAYKDAACFQARLYLCGHTHGGQICLVKNRPIVTNSRAPRYTAAGAWEYQGMTGYTSRGVGASSVPLRFNCPGEICLITLRRSPEVEVENCLT
jgi:predicted MPP superfamily phosphohydrolase